MAGRTHHSKLAGGTGLLDDSQVSRVLVALLLGRIYGAIRGLRSARSSAAISHLLQIRSAGRSGAAQSPGKTERTRRHEGARGLRMEAFGKEQEGQCCFNRARKYTADYPGRHTASELLS